MNTLSVTEDLSQLSGEHGAVWDESRPEIYGVSTVSVRLNHIDSYKLLAAQAVGVSSGSVWMDELASPGRTAARY
jgi:hypothetical protein